MKTNVLRASDLHQIAWEMTREFQTETICRFGDARGLGMVRAGQCITGRETHGSETFATVQSYEYSHVGRWDYSILFDLPTPKFEPHETPPEEIKPEGRKLLGLVTQEDAIEWLKRVARAIVNNVLNDLTDAAIEKISNRQQGGFVAEAVRQIAMHVLRKQLKNAAVKVADNLLGKQQTRKGPQRISTRKRIAGKRGWVIYSGRWAWRNSVGRPALPASEWLRRYRARRAKENKTGSTRRRTLRPPATNHPRPKVLLGFRTRGVQEWSREREIDREAVAESVFGEVWEDVKTSLREELL